MQNAKEEYDLHITHIYFFQELGQALGRPIAGQWLASSLVNERTERYKNQMVTAGRYAQLSSNCHSSGQIPKLVDIESEKNAERNKRKTGILTKTSSASLHAWDITNVEFTAGIHVERSRSSPAVFSPQSTQTMDPKRMALLFTDAAHIVVNDFDRSSTQFSRNSD